MTFLGHCSHGLGSCFFTPICSLIIDEINYLTILGSSYMVTIWWLVKFSMLNLSDCRVSEILIGKSLLKVPYWDWSLTGCNAQVGLKKRLGIFRSPKCQQLLTYFELCLLGWNLDNRRLWLLVSDGAILSWSRSGWLKLFIIFLPFNPLIDLILDCLDYKMLAPSYGTTLSEQLYVIICYQNCITHQKPNKRLKIT